MKAKEHAADLIGLLENIALNTKTVVGDALQFGDVTLIPVVDVTLGWGGTMGDSTASGGPSSSAGKAGGAGAGSIFGMGSGIGTGSSTRPGTSPSAGTTTGAGLARWFGASSASAASASASTGSEFGTGWGAGAWLKPRALVIIRDDKVSLLPVSPEGTVDKLIEAVPDLLEKLAAIRAKTASQADDAGREKTASEC